MITARLYRIILPVHDINASVKFYSFVFEAAGERVSPGRHYFNCGGTVLAVYSPEADGDDAGLGWSYHENQYLYFSVSDLPAYQDRIETAGGQILTHIEKMPWGEELFYALDPEKTRLSFVDAKTIFTGSN